MQNFLHGLLSLTVGGSILTVALLLLGRVKKLPKSFFYYAWLLVLLRLALPLPGNLELNMPDPPGVLVTSESGFPRVVFPADVAWDEAIWNENVPAETTPVRPYLDVKETPNPIQPVYMSPKTMGVWEALGILWALGVIFCLGRDLGGYGRFRLGVKKTLLPPLPSDVERFEPLAGKGGPRLLRSAAIDSPMLMGLVRPVLLLPDRDYAPEILDCIFRHELTHFRRGDILMKWLAMPILAAHWFNPLTILIRREFHQSCELSCDERILKTMNHDQRKCYGETLLYMAQPDAPARTALSTSFCVEKKNLKERLVHIMNFGPKSRWILAATALLVVGILAACMLLGPAREEVSEEPEETAVAQPVEVTEEYEGYMGLGFRDEPRVYTGDPLHITCRLTASHDSWGEGIGLLLLLDGRPQPYKTEDSDELLYMHTFHPPMGGGPEIGLIFDPVAGHEGETVDLAVMAIKNPDRCTVDPNVPFDHSSGALGAICQVEFQAEPGETGVPAVRRREKEANISMEDTDLNGYEFRFTPGTRLDGKQQFHAAFSGPVGAQLCYTIYLNNEPVAWEHFFEIKGKQQVVIDTTLDFEDFQGDGMVYAVLYGKNPKFPGDNFLEISETYYITAPRDNQPTPGNPVETDVVVVSNVDELLDAIGPDTSIVLKKGTYDLTTAKTYGKQNVSDYYRWDEVRDGYGLTVCNVDNVNIWGTDASDVELVTQPRYAPVVRFANCTDVTIRSLTAGHTEGVEGCSGAVFQMWGSKGFEVRNCDLYGCGTYGIEADNCEKITMANSTIRDCSYGAANFISCVDAFLYENKIFGIGKPESFSSNAETGWTYFVPESLFRFDSSSNCGVMNCQISDSVADKLLVSDISQQIYFMGNTGKDLHIQRAVFASRDSALTVDGCELKFQGNPPWFDENYGDDFVYSTQGEKLYAEDLDEMKYRSYPMPISETKPAEN